MRGTHPGQQEDALGAAVHEPDVFGKAVGRVECFHRPHAEPLVGPQYVAETEDQGFEGVDFRPPDLGFVHHYGSSSLRMRQGRSSLNMRQPPMMVLTLLSRSMMSERTAM